MKNDPKSGTKIEAQPIHALPMPPVGDARQFGTNPKVGQPDMVERLRRPHSLGDHWSGETEKRCAEADDLIVSLQSQLEAAEALADRLKLEAQCHAGEARAANSTIYEIYQVLSGSKGEPGNWNGAEPARAYVAASQAERDAMREALKKIGNSPQSSWQALAEHYEAIAADALQPQGDK